ncbi:hypothetical protein [Pseudomonas putida]|uniref:Uncharacterized protein n=1 Tax=Pseudomonas putida TaxID=303 RepID=A0A8I1ECZ6_PSEPU|nr:hypothetical protein [Pseudomonas putida]MBI6883256.1 hypothetical protein [Pseudomonas putida]
MTTTFSFLAASHRDIERFRDEVTNEGIPLRWNLKPEVVAPAGIEVHMQTSVDLDTIKNVMHQVPDSQFMFETLREVPYCESHAT